MTACKVYLDSEFPGLPVLGFGLFSFIHLPYSRVLSSEAIEGAGNSCFTVPFIKIYTILAMIQAGQPQKTRVIGTQQGWLRTRQLHPVCVRGRETASCFRGALGAAERPQTQPLKVLDGHWCCCIAGNSKPRMQHEEKRGLWVVQGCFLILLAFVLALSELWAFSAQRNRV